MNHSPESAGLSGSAEAWSAARSVNAHGALPHSDAPTFQSATTFATLSTLTETIKAAQKVGFFYLLLCRNCDLPYLVL